MTDLMLWYVSIFMLATENNYCDTPSVKSVLDELINVEQTGHCSGNLFSFVLAPLEIATDGRCLCSFRLLFGHFC